LLVVYEVERLHMAGETALAKRLARIGQNLVQFRVNARRYDIPRLLANRPEPFRSVFSISRVARGGGKEGANAYRALNMRREYFVERSLRVVLWLSQEELVALSRHAPDFWAFRHRVVELPESAEDTGRINPREGMPG